MVTRCRSCFTKIEFKTTYCERCLMKTNKEKENGFKDKKIEATTKSARWKAVRRKVLLRDKSICVLCYKKGFIEYRKLQVHHIVKRTENEDLIYEPSNLVTLCITCHKEVENLSVSKQKKIFGNFEEETIRLL